MRKLLKHKFVIVLSAVILAFVVVPNFTPHSVLVPMAGAAPACAAGQTCGNSCAAGKTCDIICLDGKHKLTDVPYTDVSDRTNAHYCDAYKGTQQIITHVGVATGVGKNYCSSATKCDLICQDETVIPNFNPTQSNVAAAAAAACKSHSGTYELNDPGVYVKQQAALDPQSTSTTEDPALEYSSSQGASMLVKDYLNPLIVLLSVIFGILVVIGVILGGIQYSTSAGDPQKAAAAKGRIMKVLIALVAYLFLYAFLKFIIPPSWGVV